MTMTEQQALEIITKATALLNMNRDAHLQVMQALNVLGKMIEKTGPVEIVKSEVK
jgi:hypothetical protein